MIKHCLQRIKKIKTFINKQKLEIHHGVTTPKKKSMKIFYQGGKKKRIFTV